MKQYSFFMMLLLLSTACLAQKEDDKKSAIPAAAKSAFEKAFPGSSNVKWGKEDANYEAEFKQNGKTMSAEFDSKGTLLETEENIKTSELPASILQYIKNNYKGARIKEAARVTKPNGEVNYEAEVNKTDLIFDAKGNFLKEEKD